MPTRVRSTGIEMDPVKFRDDSAFSAMVRVWCRLLRVTKTVQLVSTVTRVVECAKLLVRKNDLLLFHANT